MFVFLLKLYSFSIHVHSQFYVVYFHTHMHKTRLNSVVDETPRSCGLGVKQLGGNGMGVGGGAKWLRIKNRGEMTRGEMSWGQNILLNQLGIYFCLQKLAFCPFSVLLFVLRNVNFCWFQQNAIAFSDWKLMHIFNCQKKSIFFFFFFQYNMHIPVFKSS